MNAQSLFLPIVKRFVRYPWYNGNYIYKLSVYPNLDGNFYHSQYRIPFSNRFLCTIGQFFDPDLFINKSFRHSHAVSAPLFLLEKFLKSYLVRESTLLYFLNM
jgi:hypothetical protein